MMMDGMMGWGMFVWTAVGILLIVLLIVVIVRVLKK
jgi:heme exporter protein D